MKYIHLLIRSIPPQQPFRDFEFAKRTWRNIQNKFPNALAGMLMPNHVHLLISLPESSANTLTLALARAQSTLRGAVESSEYCWEKMPPPQFIPDRQHLRRMWRYIALNPTRKGLVRDPMLWPWSTYRDLFCAAFPRWVSNESLAVALGENTRGLSDRLYDFASKNETGPMRPTPPPLGIDRRREPIDPMEQLLYAVSAAMQMKPEQVLSRVSTRRAFVRFAKRQGWGQRTHHALIARFSGVHRRTIGRAFRRCTASLKDAQNSRPEDPLIQAAAKCLSDARLTEFLHWKMFWN